MFIYSSITSTRKCRKILPFLEKIKIKIKIFNHEKKKK